MVTIHSQSANRGKDVLHSDAYGGRCTQPSKAPILKAWDACDQESGETCQYETEASCKMPSKEHPECVGASVVRPCRCPSTPPFCKKHEEASRKHNSLDEGFEETTVQQPEHNHKEKLSNSALLALKKAIAGLQQKEHSLFEP